MDLVELGLHEWVTSKAVENELSMIPDMERRMTMLEFMNQANEMVKFNDQIEMRAIELQVHNIMGMDAVHLAFAELGQCDVLLTTDDAFVRKAQRLSPSIVRVENPAKWLNEVIGL